MPKKTIKTSGVASSSKKVFNADHLMNLSFRSPYTDQDLENFELAWSSTLAGTVLDKKLEFVFGGGIKPTFELIDSQGMDQKAINKALEAYEPLKQKITNYEQSKNINFQQNIQDASLNAKVFGRSVLAFEPEGGENPPNALKIIHPRNLGAPEINEEDWSVKSVALGKGSTESIDAQDMIYLMNKPNNPIRDNRGYGFSEFQRILGSSKALRRLMEFDAPEIAQTMWANYGMFLVDTEGLTDDKAQTKINTILSSLKAGAFNAVSGKKDEIQWFPLELKAHVNDIVNLVNMYERYIDGSFGVPSALLGREEDSNMATLFGKIRLFLTGPVRADREWLGSILADQWYKRLVNWFEPEALEKIRVKVEFEPLIIEEWADQVDAVLKLKQAIPSLPDKSLLQLLNLEEFTDDLGDTQQIIKDQQTEQNKFVKNANKYFAALEARKKK